MIGTRAVVTCAVLLAWQATAESRNIRQFQVANWKGGAYTKGNTEEFNHCAASARYRSGVYVLFSVNRRYQWSVGFGNPNWQLKPREVYPIAFSIDGREPIGAKAIAITRTTVEVPLADNAALFERFRFGRLLKVAAANQVFSFRLTDTSKLLPVLLQCVRDSIDGARLANRSSNPFVPPSTTRNPFAPSPPGSADASNRAEATMIAANLMSLSGIKGFRILSREETSSVKADAVWRAGDTIGSVRILSAKVADDIKKISGLLIGNDARQCKGTFASGALPEQGNDAMVRVFTSCKTGDKMVTAYYLALTRKRGGYYLFATLSSGSELPAKEADASIRQAVLNALPK